MLQGGGLDVQCHNNNTYCRADVARCQRIQRERMNWRRDCRADYDRAFQACTSKLAPLRNTLNGPSPSSAELKQRRDRYYEQRCGHTRSGAGRCEIEIASCPANNFCNQQYRQCVRDMTAALGKQNEENQRARAEADNARASDSSQSRRFMPENRATNTSSKPRLTDEQVQSLADRIRGAQRASAAAAELRTQAFRYIGQGNVTGLDRLFDQGLSPNVKDEAGRSLMHAAASPPYSLRGDNVEMLEYLIARGMSANVRNNKNQTPVFLAMQRRIDL
ncbi:MAG: ankyrin repeat domain-containing protein, partial [Pseudomonadota bacterium]